MIRFYCTACQKSQSVIIERLETDVLNGSKIWGDIICKECHFVIATVEADEPGQYDFIKIENLPDEWELTE